MRLPAVFLAASLLAGLAQAQHDAASVAAERARIARERELVEAEFKSEEKACYAKFAVNDCLAAAKAKRRQAAGNLRRQEIALNDAERKRKAMQRAAALEERAGAQRAPQAAPARQPASRPQRTLRANERGAAAIAAQQQDEAKRRAEKQAEGRARAEEAAQRRREHEQRVAEARERQEKLRKRLAERRKAPASSLQDPR